MRHLNLTTKQALRLAAGLSVASAVNLALFLRKIEKATDRTHDKAVFLADIVNRNIDRLDDFDKIALENLGLLAPKELDS